MTPLLLALVLASPTLEWDGQSPIDVPVGDAVEVALPKTVRFVSVGAGDVVDLGVSRDLRTLHLKGLRRGTRTIVAHFKDRTRARLELRVSASRRR